MPTSVDSIFRAIGCRPTGPIQWGERLPVDVPGVYVVSLSSDARSESIRTRPTISLDALEALLQASPRVTLDNAAATMPSLRRRLDGFVVGTEPIQYIGVTTGSVRTRVGQYVATRLGSRSPHAGGWFLKTLVGFDNAFVFGGASENPQEAERAALALFARGVDPAVRSRLHDPDRVMPFANLEFPAGSRKRHGIGGATGSRRQILEELHARSTRVTRFPEPEDPMMHRYFTQVVTDKDVSQGQIRIPSRSKDLFPVERARIDIAVGGRPVSAVAWNPRFGPPERSGVVRPGREAMRRVTAGRRLLITVIDGRFWFDDPAAETPSEVE